MNAAIEHVQAVAFDLDGTLCDSVPDLAAAAEAMLEQLGMKPLPAKVVESYVGDGIGKLVHRVLTNDRDREADSELWEKGFVSYMKYYRDHLSVFTRPYPETEAGLALLKSLGIPLVIITNKNEILAAELLKQLGLADYFSLILGGDSLPEKKPSPLPECRRYLRLRRYDAALARRYDPPRPDYRRAARNLRKPATAEKQRRRIKQSVQTASESVSHTV
ncbi:phosphoglycolate phosphatase [Neisseria gonorrhoeae]|nr:phosphoglycolate phosphatase [Neisseria gonorrhoeae]